MILEDDESGSCDLEVPSGLGPVNVGTPAFELSQPSHEAWFDVEDGYVADEDGTTRITSEEFAPQKDVGRLGDENASSLESDMQAAFEELLSAASPSLLRLASFAEPSNHQTRHEDEGDEEQKEEEESGGNDYYRELEQRGKRQYPDVGVSSENHHLESSGHVPYAGDEDDEEPQPAKRRRQPRSFSDTSPTILLQHSSKAPLRQSRSPTPSSTQSVRDESPPQANYQHLPTPAECHPTSPKSRSPSARVAPAVSALAAEYREWPFQGFLKRVTVGKQTTYNLEFSLPCISEHLNVSHHSEVPGASFSEPSAEDPVSSRSVTSRITRNGNHVQSKRSLPQENIPSRRPRFSAKEDKLLVQLKEKQCLSWDEIVEQFPERSKGSLQVHYSTKLKSRSR